MKTTSRLAQSFFALSFLCFAVALSSCSKKDVVQDEPLMAPSDDLGDGGDTTDTGAGSTSQISGSALRALYFDYDRYNMTSEGKAAARSNADWLKANPNATVQVEGHCDERGTTEYNLALGERRANAAMNYLSQLGISRSRMSSISYGEERPANPGHDEAAWAENRRAEFVIVGQ